MIKNTNDIKCEGGELNPYAISGASTSIPCDIENPRENRIASKKRYVKIPDKKEGRGGIRSAFRQQVRIGIVGLFAMSGCASPRPLDVGYRGSEDGYVKALIAADYWNTACRETLVVVHKGEGDVQMREQAGLADGRYGETFTLRVGKEEPYLIKFMAGSDALGTITHELGHALGIKGHRTDGDIMNPRISGGYAKPSEGADALDPTDRTAHTLRAGLIDAEDCAAVLAR